jgi:hypothetical protein
MHARQEKFARRACMVSFFGMQNSFRSDPPMVQLFLFACRVLVIINMRMQICSRFHGMGLFFYSSASSVHICFFFGVLVYVYEGHNVFLVFLLAHVNLAHKNSSNTCIVTAFARQDIDVLAVVLTGVYVAKRR